ncbi:MAG: rRNA maturation RNase YbeY [Bacilli bacterium]|nr:rRNA maturation RNase YbeY [Bacilli bacterium]
MFEIFNETNEKIDELKDVEMVLKKAIEIEKLGVVNFNVIIVDNEFIHKMNKEYRGIDRPTDVISFALEDEHDIDYDDFRLLGDIYISIDKAKEQAKEYGHSLRREICFLSVHGLLHLLGYDHMEKEDEKVMFARQEMILNEAGIEK